MKWIRWRGLIAFLVVVGIGLVFWFFLIDGLVKRAIEGAGSRLIGAKVELDGADVSLFPLGIELKRLQVTNPDEPMRNAVEIARVAFGMEAGPIFLRKVIIDEMAVDGLQFNTPRRASGEIVRRDEKKEKTEEADSFFSIPSVDLPSAKEILAKEELETLKLAASVRTEIEAGRERWKERVAQMPDKAKLDEYKRRADEIKKSTKGGVGAVLGSVKEAAELRKEVMADLDRVKGARRDLADDIQTLRRRVDEAAAAPQADLKRLKEKYTLSAGGMANVAAALFGGTIGRWAKTSAVWYERLQPLLAGTGKSGDAKPAKPPRGSGIDVRFPERKPLPNFLIRTARVGAEIPAGTLIGQVRQITPDQDLLGAPMTFEFKGDKLKQLRSVSLRGEINRVLPNNPRDTFALDAGGYAVQRAVLSANPKWPVVLEGAEAGLDVKAVVAGGALDATFDSKLSGVRFSTGTQAPEGRVANEIASSLADVKAFHVGATVTGPVGNPKVAVTSDLEPVLRKAAGRLISKRTERLEADLKAGIAEKVNGPLADLKKQLGGYGELNDALASRSDAINGLLAEKLSPKIKGPKLSF